MSGKENKVEPWKSFVAGGVAGGIEATITYPFEFAKTRLQLVDKSANVSRNPLKLLYNTAKAEGLGPIYAGCGAFVMGNTAKAAIRFLGFDTIKDMLRDEDGNLSKTRGVVAGLGAGVLESVFAMTPFETIKTAMIDDRRSPNPKYQGMIKGPVNLFKDNGFRGIYKGLLPVTLRQASNQMVRLGSYNAMKTFVQQKKDDPTAPLSSAETFGIGAIAGIITVYSTMPVDVVKTRMQSLDAVRYSSTWNCFYRIGKEEGMFAYWRGATPRLGRLVLSGGIVFTIYEKVMLLLQ